MIRRDMVTQLFVLVFGTAAIHDSYVRLVGAWHASSAEFCMKAERTRMRRIFCLLLVLSTGQAGAQTTIDLGQPGQKRRLF